ncbi:MAG: TSUP family transporter, partial [Actinomycetales bacterium]|nr:TSUP family transporter [Actinomycetales bacterium]
LIGLGIGMYDGALGPGTGSFFVFAMVGLLGYGFLQASAKAKIANWATNLAALCVFIPMGAVMWKVGLLMGLCNMLGGYLGARTAVARGSGFVRTVFVVLLLVFIVKIGYDTWAQFSG